MRFTHRSAYTSALKPAAPATVPAVLVLDIREPGLASKFVQAG